MLCSPISDLMEAYSFLYLCEYAFVRYAVAGMESVIVAIAASARTYGSVPVWAGEACIYHEFLQAFPVEPPVIASETVVSFSFREFHIFFPLPCGVCSFARAS